MDRAYSVITVKSIDEDQRTFTGIATTPTPDRMQDVVEPDGAQFKLPIPLLWQHDSRQPIGHVTAAKVGKDGITVTAKLVKMADPGKLKDRLDEAWQSIKSGLVRGLSIGFRGIETQDIKDTWGIRFVKWDWLELSAVTVAANADCSITAIKSIDQALLAASGRARGAGGRQLPGASGLKHAASGGNLNSRLKGTQVKTLKELREERNTMTARQEELINLAKSEDRDMTDEEGAEFDELQVNIKAMATEIRVAEFNATQAAAAKPADGGSQKAASASRGGMSFVRKQDPDDKFEGQSYIRAVKLKALSRLTHEPVGLLAERFYAKTNPRFVEVMKAAVAGGGTGSGEWGAELLALNAMYEGDFIEYLYGMTIFDRLALTEVPANVRIKGQDGAAAASWVGQSKAIPVTKDDYSSVDLTPLKVAAICVLSNDLITDSSPAADRLVRDSLVEASAQKVDTTFFSTDVASSGVSPAGILNGLTPIQASGTDEAAVRTDLQALLYPFVQAKMASGLVICMNPAQGLAIGSMVNTFSMPSFPGLNENGGTLGGRTVYAGDNVTAGQIVALRPRDIWKIGEGGVQVSMSDVATIEMNDAPAGASDTPTAMASHAVSMFQTESTAFKVVRRINFQKRRSNAVVYIDNAEYGGVAS